MNWQTMVIVQSLLVAIAMVIMRLLARDKKTARSGLAITAGWFVVLYICGLIIYPLYGDANLASLQAYWPRFIVGGFAFTISGLMMYQMFIYLDAAVGTILTTVNAIFTVIGAEILLHEGLTATQAIGSMLLLTSIIYAVLATRHKRTRQVHRSIIIGAMYALAAGFFYAVAAVNEKSLLSHVSVGDYIIFGWGLQMLAAVGAVVLLKPSSLSVLFQPQIIGWVLVLGVIRAVSGLLFMLAQIKSNNVALVTVVSNFRLIAVAALGYWILRENKKTRQKIIGSVAAIISLTIIFWH